MVPEDLRLYILMRNDLQSMVPGRCMAQASHATSVLEHEFGNGSKCERVEVKEWKQQAMGQGFGTTIVLAGSKAQIDELFSKAPYKRWIIKGWVIDPDYVIRVTHEVARFMKGVKFIPQSADEKTIAFTRAEKTCAFIFGTKADFPDLADWPLY